MMALIMLGSRTDAVNASFSLTASNANGKHPSHYETYPCFSADLPRRWRNALRACSSQNSRTEAHAADHSLGLLRCEAGTGAAHRIGRYRTCRNDDCAWSRKSAAGGG